MSAGLEPPQQIRGEISKSTTPAAFLKEVVDVEGVLLQEIWFFDRVDLVGGLIRSYLKHHLPSSGAEAFRIAPRDYERFVRCVSAGCQASAPNTRSSAARGIILRSPSCTVGIVPFSMPSLIVR